MEGPKNFKPFKLKSGEAILWDIYSESDESYMATLERIFAHVGPQPPKHVNEKKQSLWKHFYQAPKGGKHSQTNPLLANSKTLVFIVSPLMELEHFFNNSNARDGAGSGAGSGAGGGEVDQDDVPEFMRKYLVPDDVEQKKNNSRPNSADRGNASTRKNATLNLRAWTGGRFLDDDDEIRKFTAFILSANLFARHIIESFFPNSFATYHTHVVKNDGMSVGGKRYNLALQDLEKEFGEKRYIDNCNIRMSFKETYLKRNNPEGGIWRIEYPRGYNPDTGFSQDAGYIVSSLEEFEACQSHGKCYVQILFHIGYMYEYVDETNLNRGITLDVYSIAYWPTPMEEQTRISSPGNSGNLLPMFARDMVAIKRERAAKKAAKKAKTDEFK